MFPAGPEFDLARDFAVSQKLVVLSTASLSGEPEAALMGVATTAQFELIFDTRNTSRKFANLAVDPRLAAVIGCTGGVSIQYEGLAEELTGARLERYLPIYFAAFPDGPERRTWPDIAYFVVRPVWLRYCDYVQRPPLIREFHF